MLRPCTLYDLDCRVKSIINIGKTINQFIKVPTFIRDYFNAYDLRYETVR